MILAKPVEKSVIEIRLALFGYDVVTELALQNLTNLFRMLCYWQIYPPTNNTVPLATNYLYSLFI